MVESTSSDIERTQKVLPKKISTGYDGLKINWRMALKLLSMKKSRLLASTVLLAWLSVLSTNAVQATVTYQYSGNNFTNATSPYDTSMSISGSFTVSSLLINVSGSVNANSFSFSDGVNTITNGDTNGVFLLDTDSSGNILNWIISLFVPPPPILGEMGIQIDTSGIPTISGFQTVDRGIIFQCASAAFGQCRSFSDLASGSLDQFDNPGNWSIVPTPPALWLFGSGLLGLIGIARKKAA